MKISNERYCIFSKKKYDVNYLVKITFCKKNNSLFFNQNLKKGRSVYFKIDAINKIKLTNVINLILSKLKIKNNGQYYEVIKSFLESEVIYGKKDNKNNKQESK